jgi:hypothetical protein
MRPGGRGGRLGAMNLRIMVPALGAALTLGLAACGGGDDSSSSDKALSKSELATRADAICQARDAAAEKVKPPADFGQPNSDPVAAATYLEQLAAITRKEATDLKAVTPEDAAKADWAGLVTEGEALATFLDGLVAKAKAKDASGIDDIPKLDPIAQRFKAAAQKVGSKDCANVS